MCSEATSQSDVAPCCFCCCVPHTGSQHEATEARPPPSSQDESRGERGTDGEQRLFANDLS
jgi:hypothetical protein